MREGFLTARSRSRKGLIGAVAIPIAVVQVLLVGVMAAPVAHPAGNPGVTEFPLPCCGATPFGVVTGPDGDMWFTDGNSSNIGKVTPSGILTEYALPSFGSAAGMTAGPDGNIWFADYAANEIGKTTTAGVITEYSVPTGSPGLEFITAGPDGNLWFTEAGADKIGKITTSGAITEFSVSAGAGLMFITPGPDGNIWFTEKSLDKVGRITPGGTVTEFPVTAGAGPNGIVAGPDGNMWFTETTSNNIGRISTTGTGYVEFPIPTASSNSWGITAAPDGNLWFGEVGPFGGTPGNALGQVTTAGVVTEFTLGTSAGALGITTGPDGNIWYAGYRGGVIGRFAPGKCATLADTASPGLVGAGSSETVGVALTSCGATTLNASTTTVTAVPSGCPAAPAIPSFNSSLTFSQTDSRTTTFAAPSCPGTYTVTSQTTVGATVMATGTASYKVLAVGGGALFSTSTRPQWIAAGSDGNLWYTDSTSSLGQVTPSGVVTYFSSVFQGSGSATQLTTGSDGDLYVNVFVGGGNGLLSDIANVKPGGSGGTTFRWEVPVNGTSINDLAPGPDGNVWFAGQPSAGPGGTIGFVTPAGKVKLFHLPLADGAPFAITSGSDGALWFSLGSEQLGRISTAGAVTLFTVPSPMTSLSSASNTLALGPDGNVWFLGGDSSGHGIVGRISPTGAVSEYATGQPSDRAAGITAGADGNLWFNQPNLDLCGFGGGVGRVTPSGVVSDFGAGCGDTNARYNIVAGPDGNVWNAAYYGIGINLIATGAPVTCTALAATVGASSVVHGATQTVAATIANCATTPQLMRLTTKTTSTCGFSATTKHVVPLQPLVATVVSDSTTTTCKGTYTDKLTLTVGTTVVASEKVTYQVT